MLEIPESKTIGSQAGSTLANKRILDVITATSPHKFAFYNGDPEEYVKLLAGKEIKSANGHGMFVDLHCADDVSIIIGEGTNVRYFSSFEQRPEKHQLLIVFNDGSCMAFTVAMYGLIWACRGVFDNPYHKISLKSISPLDDAFDESYFDRIGENAPKNISMKALLATEQRIPGVGNGVLQDILFNSGIHPRQKKSALTDSRKGQLFNSLKTTLKRMTDLGGRDTEKDLFGQAGGYKTVLSKNTLKSPCPGCGGTIRKEPYLGGAVYFCPVCQKL